MSLVKNRIYQYFSMTVIGLFSVNFSALANDSYEIKKVASGFGVPWGLDFISNTEALLTEKRGRLYRVQLADTGAKITEIQGVPNIMQVGQGGLLDVRIAPNSPDKSPIIYFTYVDGSTMTGKSHLPTLKLGRAVLTGNRLTEQEVLFEANEPQRGGRHFGSRITFDGQGHLFFSMGDRGQRENSQNLSKHSGSIFRLKLDGSVPADNPFVGQADAMPEIWSYGHRNPQGLMFDRNQGVLWSIEHGPQGGDEINRVEKGKNYGWPVISYGREYISNRKVSKVAVKAGMEQPVYYFTPSIAPSSLLVYSGKKIPAWRGRLLSGALKLRHLNVVELDHAGRFVEEARFFEAFSQRIRQVVENPAGDIFFTTDNGEVFQVLSELQ